MMAYRTAMGPLRSSFGSSSIRARIAPQLRGLSVADRHDKVRTDEGVDLAELHRLRFLHVARGHEHHTEASPRNARSSDAGAASAPPLPRARTAQTPRPPSRTPSGSARRARSRRSPHSRGRPCASPQGYRARFVDRPRRRRCQRSWPDYTPVAGRDSARVDLSVTDRPIRSRLPEPDYLVRNAHFLPRLRG